MLGNGFARAVDSWLAAHVGMETCGRGWGLASYVRPTGQAFAAALDVLPVAIEVASGRAAAPETRRLFRQSGRLVGEALIAFDCAVDLPQDRRRGDYNPLAGHDDRIDGIRNRKPRTRLQPASSVTTRQSKRTAGGLAMVGSMKKTGKPQENRPPVRLANWPPSVKLLAQIAHCTPSSTG